MSDKEYVSLRDKWYKLLKVKGFNDIEIDPDSTCSSMLKGSYHNQRKKRDGRRGYDEVKERYYDACINVLHTYNFKYDRYRRVWELHAEGYTFKKIAEMVGMHKTSTFRIVSKIRRDNNIIRLCRT